MELLWELVGDGDDWAASSLCMVDIDDGARAHGACCALCIRHSLDLGELDKMMMWPLARGPFARW